MPSLSSILKPSRLSLQFENRSSLQNGNTEHTHSKRSFFRRLMKRASLDSRTPPPPTQQKDPKSESLTVLPEPLKPDIPPKREQASPMLDSNKPLPPPPPPGNTDELPINPTLKLDRILTPYAKDDLQNLFSGAPHFLAAVKGCPSRLAHSSVVFPYNDASLGDISDHVPIQDEAWDCVTAWPHRATGEGSDQSTSTRRKEQHGQLFEPCLWERPSMLSMQGLERGTFGFQAALEIAAADAFEESDGFDVHQFSQHRWRALNSKEGVRPLTDSALIERLRMVADIYEHDSSKDERSSIQLYTELFTHILHPPSRVTDIDDPYSLLVQIEALVHVLSVPSLWFDFSKVEWRIRLGQLLWTNSWELEEDVEINSMSTNTPSTQKYWLLLQVLLSCELLQRLDIVAANAGSSEVVEKAEEIRHFEKTATPSVRWSVLLARRWLDNIKILKSASNDDVEAKPAAGWLASLTGSSQQAEVAVMETVADLKFEGRHQARQVRGLVHFARKIQWPNIEIIVQKVSANGVALVGSLGNNTPIATPRSVSTQRSSYFSSRPGLRRGLSSINDRMSAIIHPAGWLSNSYISGLILPGESLSHFLISTLLENDTEAVAKLGEEASLYGGFVYQSRSFWSSSCIVGRVLAAGKDAKECMGWISSDIVPRGVQEAWLDIEVEPLDEYNPEKRDENPKIPRKLEIEQRGHIIAGADDTSVLPGDFIYPSDEASEEAISVTFQSLDLFAVSDTSPPTPSEEEGSVIATSMEPPQIKTYSAMMRFTLQVEKRPIKELNLSLTSDVYFLTAYPCKPSLQPVVSSPTSPSFRSSSDYKASATSGHPLYKAFTYTTVTLSKLLSTPASTPFHTLLMPPKSPTASHFSTQHTTSSRIPKVLIIDCTDTTMDMFPPHHSTQVGVPKSGEHDIDGVGSDLEILGRALCSERGWNALISRKGRGCLSCAIREAAAVGWRVILRVA